MDVSISHIFLFNDKKESRFLKFDAGLNIITGDSKTGKSAVIEIIDYCLFASRSTIPKGIITDWTNIYCIILKVKEKFLVIARFSNSKKVYFAVEVNSDFIEEFSLDYFEDKKTVSPDDAKREFEKHIGIAVLDTRTDDDESKVMSGGKVTMRSFVPFLFQHQNLIANKHSLFYRFDDFYKRKKTIDDYPLLMGWGSAEYFDLQRRLSNKQKELTQKKRLDAKLKISNEQLRQDLFGIISLYMTFLGKELDDSITLKDLKKLSKDLPKSNNNSIGDRKIELELNKIDKLISNKKQELNSVKSLISIIESNNDVSKNYTKNIKRLRTLASIEPNLNSEEILCPLCEQEVDSIKDKITVIQESNELLEAEFEKIGTYLNDTSSQSTSLRKERDLLKKELRELNVKAEKLNGKIIDEFNTQKDYEEGLLLKGKTEANAKYLIERNKLISSVNTDYSELEHEIEYLKSKLEGFNLKEKLQEAQTILNEKMTAICNLLDFEEEFKPGKILFNLENFSLKYNTKDNENILLSEMGSGSNWLAIHLSTFLGFLYLHSITPSSKIPSILILDQPSQVYFPKVYKELDEDVDDLEKLIDDNIVQVKNIFKVITNEILKIEKECGYKPQVIVLEHADEEDFEQFIKYRWEKNGKKLI